MPAPHTPVLPSLGVALILRHFATVALAAIASPVAAQEAIDAHAENELWPSATASASLGGGVDVGAVLRMKLREPSGAARERGVGAAASLTAHGVRVAVTTEWLTHWGREAGEPSSAERRFTVDATHDLVRASRLRLWQRPRVESRDFGERHAYRIGDRLQLELRAPRAGRANPGHSPLRRAARAR
jgi:hypothetical protein